MFIGTKSAWADDDGLENVEAKNGHEQEDNQSGVNKSLLPSNRTPSQTEFLLLSELKVKPFFPHNGYEFS